MDCVRINDVLLHYRLAGPADAPVLALVNSLGTDARIWDGVIDILSARYRVLSYDKRGHGLSDTPPGDYALEDHVDDLTGLLDHLGIERLALAGVSVGGLIAQGLALRDQERLAALILCDTAPKVGDAAGWNARIDTVRKEGLGAIADLVMDRWFSPDFQQQHPDALAGWRNLFLRSDPVGYAATCATLRDTDLTAQIGAIATPTLVVAGEADRSTPVELVRSCAESIAGSRFEILPGVGHIPSIEQPAELAALILGFLKEHGHG
ncbi:3-oxoadipate enol-lactonase [Devosia ginsengisoli]|uniref:3-oxoadipate enol-lactonase n=1 Tax=Devosia ginsengisoli TaxID=400770 RepID=UPI0026EB9819|nr:3-oxoadipate enol-lactonase [Devosia ginsengisoli]MCR6673470.1 3-oxoadipate enol-lactonase [Devosia ginsengisoli]